MVGAADNDEDLLTTDVGVMVVEDIVEIALIVLLLIDGRRSARSAADSV